MAEIKLPYNWSPRPYQKPLWDYLSAGGKRAVVSWHRRSGKDAVMLHHSACASFERVGNLWYLMPEYSQCRKALWQAVNPHTGKLRLDEAFPHEIRESTNQQEMGIKLKNGSTFQLVGSDNFDSLVGSTPVGLVFSEYALSNPSAWGFLRPILLENNGWACFNSTPRGKNHFKRLFELAKGDPEWFNQMLTADQTGVFTPEQLANELKEMQSEHGEEYGLSLFMQEYHCSFDSAMPGSIWGDCIAKLEAAGRVATEAQPVLVPHTEGHPVFTGWDLGFDDDTTCWFYQVIGDELHVIDYEEDNFKDVEFYAQMLLNKHIKDGYEYGIHWLPHDARPRTIAAGGKSILQQFQDFNNDHDKQLGRFAIAPRLDVQEGIQAARATFPKCRFDARCEIGVDHLKAYRRDYDEENNVFSANPKHDGASHAADGFRTLSTTWRRSKVEAKEPSFHEKMMSKNVVGLHMGQIRDNHFRKMRANREDY